MNVRERSLNFRSSPFKKKKHLDENGIKKWLYFRGKQKKDECEGKRKRKTKFKEFFFNSKHSAQLSKCESYRK